MRIKGYTVDTRDMGGVISWMVRTTWGQIVGDVKIQVSTSGTGFCHNQHSSLQVVARGPKFFDLIVKLAEEGVPLMSLTRIAEDQAEKTGDILKIVKGGAGASDTKAQRISLGRKIAKAQAWPWLIKALEAR